MSAVRLARLASPLTAFTVLASLLVPGPAAATTSAAIPAPAATTAAATPTAVDTTPCAGAVAPGDASCTVVTRATPPTATPRRSGAATGAAGVAPITASQLRAVYGVAGRTAPAGTTVGIVTAYDAPTLEADLATFRATNGLPACTTTNGCFRKVDQRGRTVPPNKSRTVAPVYGTTGWELETSLDTQAVSAMCPSCAILVVEADGTSLTSALGPAVVQAQTLGATVISNSFAGPESADMVPADRAYWSALTVPVFAGSGDRGYENQAGTTGQGTAYYPAASPTVISVGGTSATVSGTTLMGETAWAGSGSGCTVGFARPPGQTTYFTATGLRPADAAQCSTDSRYAPPGGQPARASADLAALADPDAPGFSVVRGGAWTITGGTSLAVQLAAGIAAYAGPRPAGSSVTSVAYVLAALGGPTGLVDVTTGTNDPAGGDDCGDERVCVAQAGWDGPTGLGTPRGLSVFAPLLTVSGFPQVGAPLGVGGSNLLPGESVTIASGTTVLGAALVNQDGTWSTTVMLPPSAPNPLPVTATGSRSGLTATRAVVVDQVAAPATIGVSRVEGGARVFYLASDYVNGGGTATRVAFGNADDVPSLRPNAQGVCVPGVYRNTTATFYQASAAVDGGGTVTATQFGDPGDRPVSNDPGLTAYGDSVLTLRRPSTAIFWSRITRNPANGPAQVSVAGNAFGNPTDTGLALRGTASGGGVGVFRPGTATFYFENASSGSSDPVTSQQFGVAGDQGLVGQWIAPTTAGDPGSEYVGVFRPAQGRFYLAQRPLVVDGTQQAPQGNVRSFSFGSPGDTALSCDSA